MSLLNMKKSTAPHYPLNSNLHLQPNTKNSINLTKGGFIHFSDPSHNHIIVTFYELIHKNITKNIKKLTFHNKIKLINIHRSHSLPCIYQKQINKIEFLPQN